MLSLDFPTFAYFDQNGLYLLGFQVLILYVYAVSIKMQFCWLMQSIGISHIYKGLISKIVCDSTRKECMMH